LFFSFLPLSRRSFIPSRLFFSPSTQTRFREVLPSHSLFEIFFFPLPSSSCVFYCPPEGPRAFWPLFLLTWSSSANRTPPDFSFLFSCDTLGDPILFFFPLVFFHLISLWRIFSPYLLSFSVFLVFPFFPVLRRLLDFSLFENCLFHQVRMTVVPTFSKEVARSFFCPPNTYSPFPFFNFCLLSFPVHPIKEISLVPGYFTQSCFVQHQFSSAPPFHTPPHSLHVPLFFPNSLSFSFHLFSFFLFFTMNLSRASPSDSPQTYFFFFFPLFPSFSNRSFPFFFRLVFPPVSKHPLLSFFHPLQSSLLFLSMTSYFSFSLTFLFIPLSFTDILSFFFDSSFFPLFHPFPLYLFRFLTGPIPCSH